MISNMDMAISRALSGGGAKGGVKNAIRHPLKSAANIGEFAGGKVEAQLRAANFLSNLENGLELGYTIDEAIQFAGEQVKKYHFDYTELTNAEKTIFRRIFPFYVGKKEPTITGRGVLKQPSILYRV